MIPLHSIVIHDNATQSVPEFTLKKAIRFFLLFSFSAVGAEQQLLCNQDCTFVLKRERDSNYRVINKSRANEALSPFSTFKIPNTLIALDTGAVENLEQKLSYDKQKYPTQKWWPAIWHQKPLVIREAFQNSAVPIYQQIATEVGEKRMTSYIEGFQYGNRDISSGIDTFWLNGSLKISAAEQVNFLQRLFHEQLPVSNQSISLLKQIMLVKQTDNYRLYAKTGGGGISEGNYLGWYVGVVETNSDRYYFATNVSDSTFGKVQKKRIEVAMQQLKMLNVIDE